MNKIFRDIRHKFSQKGQADTVFEVLIAVILLGFVLVAGTYAMSSLSNTKCSKSIDISLGELKLALEKASGSTLLTTEFFFGIPYCFGSKSDIKVSLSRQTATLCNSFCPGSLGQCYLIKYANNKDKVNPVRFVCVQISPIVTLNNSSSDCQGETADSDGANGVLFMNGKYKFSSKNISTLGALPNLCIIKESGN